MRRVRDSVWVPGRARAPTVACRAARAQNHVRMQMNARPVTPDGKPYDGIAVHVRTRALAGDPGYLELWRDRTCHWCGCGVDPASLGRHDGRTFDHVVPRSDGGGDEPTNLLNSCKLCNNVRDRMDPPAFRAVADDVIRPNRDDLVAIGTGLLELGLVTEARVAWKFSGMERREATGRIHARLGTEPFDPTSKSGFADLASVLFDAHAKECSSLDTDLLLSILRGMPRTNDIMRDRNRETADLLARRNAVAVELGRRQRAAHPSTTP